MDVFKPAQIYRDEIRSILKYAPEKIKQDDACMVEFLRNEYNLCKLALQSDSNDINERIGLFIFAAGLLAFGQLSAEFVGAIVKRPKQAGGIDRLSGTVRFMLPMPDSIDPSNDPDTVLRWVEANAHRLAFSEELGRFDWID